MHQIHIHTHTYISYNTSLSQYIYIYLERGIAWYIYVCVYVFDACKYTKKYMCVHKMHTHFCGYTGSYICMYAYIY